MRALKKGEEGGRGKGSEEGSQWDATDALASTTFPRFIVSGSLFPPESFPPCSPDAFPPPFSSLSLFTDLFRLSLAAPDIFTASCRRVDLVCITPLLLRARLPFALQNCLAATIYVSSDLAAD